MAAITLASLRAAGKRVSESVLEMLSVEDTGTEYILKTKAELTGRGVQAPAVIINAQTAAAGATIYSSTVTVADFSQIGVTVSTDQGYDLMAFAGSGTGGISKTKTADVATAQAATTLTSERYHNVSSIVAGAKDVQFGVKNNGAVSATVTLRWMGHK